MQLQLKLSRLRKNRIFMKHLRLDVTPELIFQPRFIRTPEDAKRVGETQGFSFYIEALDCDPCLMLMKTYNMTSKTVGEIVDVPGGLLKNAVSKEGAKDFCGMFAIDDGLAGWISEELGLTSRNRKAAPRP
jgi:hypothetical protein